MHSTKTQILVAYGDIADTKENNHAVTDFIYTSFVELLSDKDGVFKSEKLPGIFFPLR